MLEQRSTVLESLLYQFVFVLKEFGTIKLFTIKLLYICKREQRVLDAFVHKICGKKIYLLKFYRARISASSPSFKAASNDPVSLPQLYWIP